MTGLRANCTEGADGFTGCHLADLGLYTNYSIIVAGYTAKGIGVRTDSIVIRTGPYGELFIHLSSVEI